MDYIRPQVTEFSAGLSVLMTQVPDFYSILDNPHNDTFHTLENNTHDFHQTQSMFSPGNARRFPTANNALPALNGPGSNLLVRQCQQSQPRAFVHWI